MPELTAFWKTKSGLILFLTACFGVLLLLSCFRPKQPGLPALPIVVQASYFTREPIQLLSVPLNLDPGKVRLGRELFHEVRLSADNSLSCASCHDLRKGGVDGKPVSEGIYHRHSKRNAPTVFNSGLNYRQFWDGRDATLEDQATSALKSKAAMESTWETVVTKLRKDAHYTAAFFRLYPQGIAPSALRDALATFERSLVTPGCRFDRYLRGENGALNAKELAGYQLFKSLGCISCHQGRNVGGGMMQPFGVLKSPYMLGQETGRQETRRIMRRKQGDPPGTLYKVPSLRNVARTAPYFHDGLTDTLPEAIRIMSDAQLCRHLSDEEVGKLIAFLKSLTGTYEGKPL